MNVDPGTLTRSATINDNDAAPAVTISNIGVGEGGIAAAVPVTLGAISGRTISVTVATLTTGTATAGSDFTASGPTLLTWAPGDVSPKFFNVPITDDAQGEATETVKVRLSTPVNVTIGVGTADVAISDNDGGGTAASLASVDAATRSTEDWPGR